MQPPKACLQRDTKFQVKRCWHLLMQGQGSQCGYWPIPLKARPRTYPVPQVAVSKHQVMHASSAQMRAVQLLQAPTTAVILVCQQAQA